MANKSLRQKGSFLRVAFSRNWRKLHSMKPITVAAFNSPAEAEPLKRRLIAAGIPAEIRNEPKPDGTQDYSRASAGVQIEVPRVNFEAALEIVYDWNMGEEAEVNMPERLDAIPRAATNPSAGSTSASPP